MLVFCDSFDHYATANLGEKYLSAGGSIVSGGREGNCLEVNGGNTVSKAFSNRSQLIVGFAFNPTAVGNEILSFYDAGTLQGTLKVNSSGGLEYHVYPNDDDTIIAASVNGLISPNTFQYVEINVTFETSATGTLSAQVNGQNVFTVTGVITSYSGNNWANLVALNNGPFNNNPFYYDDLYICDGTGTLNNSFLGDVSIQALLPNGAGQSTQWTPNGQSQNWQCVSQNPPNTSDYVSDSHPGDTDLYTIESISGTPTAVVAVQIVASAEKDDSNTRVLGLGFGNGSTSVFDTGFSLTSTYLMYTQPYDLNPITDEDWTVSEVDNGQIGLQVIS
jgi:hypothetical protein